MKIQSGSFGNKGSAYISRDNYLVVEGAAKSIYSSNQIQGLDATTAKQSKFSVGSFLIGALVFGTLGFFIFSIIGLLIGLALAYFGSTYSTKDDIVSISFSDGKMVTLKCSPRGVKKLVNFRG